MEPKTQTSPTQPSAGSPEKSPGNYPSYAVAHITNPNRFYAVPLLGGFVKLLMLIPVGIELLFLSIALFFMMFINSFVVLFTGKYWDPAYQLLNGTFQLTAKLYLFFIGLSNKYPGFDLKGNDDFILDITKPEKPNRLFAFPILGGLVRIILLIPFFLYMNILQNGGMVGAVISSFSVLFSARYPESTYEFIRDSQRISFAVSAYMGGLYDAYPSFAISMNHKAIKIILLIIGILLTFSNFNTNATNRNYTNSNYYNQVPTQQNPQNYNLYK